MIRPVLHQTIFNAYSCEKDEVLPTRQNDLSWQKPPELSTTHLQNI